MVRKTSAGQLAAARATCWTLDNPRIIDFLPALSCHSRKCPKYAHGTPELRTGRNMEKPRIQAGGAVHLRSAIILVYWSILCVFGHDMQIVIVHMWAGPQFLSELKLDIAFSAMIRGNMSKAFRRCEHRLSAFTYMLLQFSLTRDIEDLRCYS